MTYHEEQTQGIIKHPRRAFVGFEQRSLDVESARCKRDRQRNPESAVRTQGSSAESVSNRHFPAPRLATVTTHNCESHIPHAGQDLNKPTISIRRPNKHVRCGDAAGLHVDAA